jgi:hypothetical protein
MKQNFEENLENIRVEKNLEIQLMANAYRNNHAGVEEKHLCVSEPTMQWCAAGVLWTIVWPNAWPPASVAELGLRADRG